MKSHTDLKQSKKLADFLSLESADMGWNVFVDKTTRILPIDDWDLVKNGSGNVKFYHAWSLAALLGVLPITGKDKDTANPFIAKTPTGEYYVVYATLYKEIDSSGIYNNPIDACVEMIEKLHEQNLL